MTMPSATLKLHTALLRHLRGALRAYEDWITANQPPTIIDPDPIQHFKERREEFKQQSKS